MNKSKDYVHAISNGVKTLPDMPRDIFIFIFIGLISVSGFLAYHIAKGDSGQNKLPSIKITQATATVSNARSTPNNPAGAGETTGEKAMYVGSRSGRSYYLPTCGGVKRIKDANKVWFASVEEAIAKGYHPAAACKEMQ